MNLVRFKQNKPNNGIDRIFNDFFGGGMLPSSFVESNSHVPAVNIVENAKSFHIEIAAPGYDRNDFNVDIDGKALYVNAETANTNEEEGSSYTRREFSKSSFTRSFTLPDTVDINKVSGHYENGILFIEIPKKEEAIEPAPRRVKIK